LTVHATLQGYNPGVIQSIPRPLVQAGEGSPLPYPLTTRRGPCTPLRDLPQEWSRWCLQIHLWHASDCARTAFDFIQRLRRRAVSGRSWQGPNTGAEICGAGRARTRDQRIRGWPSSSVPGNSRHRLCPSAIEAPPAREQPERSGRFLINNVEFTMSRKRASRPVRPPGQELAIADRRRAGGRPEFPVRA
jgi:hypothetical protein